MITQFTTDASGNVVKREVRDMSVPSERHIPASRIGVRKPLDTSVLTPFPNRNGWQRIGGFKNPGFQAIP
jgi:hypothetical protein